MQLLGHRACNARAVSQVTNFFAYSEVHTFASKSIDFEARISRQMLDVDPHTFLLKVLHCVAV